MFKAELLNGELVRLHAVANSVMELVAKGFPDNNRYLVEKMLDQSQLRLSRNYDLVEVYLRGDGEDEPEDDDEDEEEKEDEEKEDEAACCKLVG